MTMALGHWLKDYIGPRSGGSGGGTEPLIVRYDHTEVDGNYHRYYFDKTWQEVANALTNFTPVYTHGSPVYTPGFNAHTEYSEDPLDVRTIINAYQTSKKFYATMNEGSLSADSADGALYCEHNSGEDS